MNEKWMRFINSFLLNSDVPGLNNNNSNNNNNNRRRSNNNNGHVGEWAVIPYCLGSGYSNHKKC